MATRARQAARSRIRKRNGFGPRRRSALEVSDLAPAPFWNMLDAGRYDTDVSAEGILEKLLFGLRVRTAERLVPVRETTKPDDLITMADSVLEGCRVPEIHEQAHAFMLHFQVFGVLEGKIEEKPLDGQDVPVEAVLEGMLGHTASLVIVGEGWLIPIMGYNGRPFGG